MTTQLAQATRGEPGLCIRLYVAGDAPNSRAAITTLRSVITQARIRVDLEIIDVLRDPEKGLRDGVLLTPMLVRIDPPPERRILGNLGDRAKLLDVLALGSEWEERRDAPSPSPESAQDLPSESVP